MPPAVAIPSPIHLAAGASVAPDTSAATPSATITPALHNVASIQ